MEEVINICFSCELTEILTRMSFVKPCSSLFVCPENSMLWPENLH